MSWILETSQWVAVQQHESLELSPIRVGSDYRNNVAMACVRSK